MKRDMIKSVNWSSHNYLLLLSGFDKTLISSTDYRKIVQNLRKSDQWEPICSMQTNRLIDRHDKANSFFSHFCELVLRKTD